MNAYQANGFKNRKDYLESLCEEYDRTIVLTLANLLGQSEDFDGLVTSLEDYSEEYWNDETIQKRTRKLGLRIPVWFDRRFGFDNPHGKKILRESNHHGTSCQVGDKRVDFTRPVFRLQQNNIQRILQSHTKSC